MAPNADVKNCKDCFLNCANAFIDEPSNRKGIATTNVDSGETISLASQRQQRLRNNRDEEIPPTVGTTARITYELDRYDKNAMLLIHNNCYKSSDKTANKAKSTFEKFRFEVEFFNNKSGDDIRAGVDRFFNRDFSEYGSVAVVVVSPTHASGPYIPRGNPYKDDDILKYFYKGVIPSLDGKPKIFISETYKRPMVQSLSCDYFSKRDIVEISLACSTFSNVHYRYINRYSLRTFCKNLDKYADTKSFVDIFTFTDEEHLKCGHSTVMKRLCTFTKELYLWR